MRGLSTKSSPIIPKLHKSVSAVVLTSKVIFFNIPYPNSWLLLKQYSLPRPLKKTQSAPTVTRWLDYFQHLAIYMNINMPSVMQNLPKWRNFAKSGHTICSHHQYCRSLESYVIRVSTLSVGIICIRRRLRVTLTLRPRIFGLKRAIWSVWLFWARRSLA